MVQRGVKKCGPAWPCGRTTRHGRGTRRRPIQDGFLALPLAEPLLDRDMLWRGYSPADCPLEDTMRSVGTAAFLLASALILLPGRAAAQDPEAPPPPPPPRQEVAPPPPAPPPAPAQHAVARTREEQQSEGRHGEVSGSERRGRESDAARRQLHPRQRNQRLPTQAMINAAPNAAAQSVVRPAVIRAGARPSAQSRAPKRPRRRQHAPLSRVGRIRTAATIQVIRSITIRGRTTRSASATSITHRGRGRHTAPTVTTGTARRIRLTWAALGLTSARCGSR